MRNYLTLTNDERHLLVLQLRAMREELKKEAKAKKIRKKKKGKKRKVVKFDNPELEKIFHEMPPDVEQWLKGKG